MSNRLTPPGHLSPSRAARTHKGDGAFHDVGAEHRSAATYGPRWARSFAPIGEAARAPRIGIVGAPVADRLAGLTVAAFVAMEGTVYAQALRLATVAARRGRLCGIRGRRASWGAPSDAGGVVSLPVPIDSGDDEEAATDAVGIVWARAAAGRYGEGAMPVGRLYTVARNLGRMRATRRIREHSPLTEPASDRSLPSDAAGKSRDELLALVPPERRAAAARMIDGNGDDRAAEGRRRRLPPVERPEGATVRTGGGWTDPTAILANAAADREVP